MPLLWSAVWHENWPTDTSSKHAHVLIRGCFWIQNAIKSNHIFHMRILTVHPCHVYRLCTNDELVKHCCGYQEKLYFSRKYCSMTCRVPGSLSRIWNALAFMLFRLTDTEGRCLLTVYIPWLSFGQFLTLSSHTKVSDRHRWFLLSKNRILFIQLFK